MFNDIVKVMSKKIVFRLVDLISILCFAKTIWKHFLSLSKVSRKLQTVDQVIEFSLGDINFLLQNKTLMCLYIEEIETT